MSASEMYNVFPVGTVSGTQHNLLIKITPEYRAALKGLEAFSHCQILWWIHEFADDSFRATTQIEPPYDAPVTGVFASRSPVRPNPIGLSVAEIISVDAVEGIIEVGGLDAYPGTPVLDIKAYFPTTDRVRHVKVPAWASSWGEWVGE
ncbi:tRNA (N6-threonylcarbamoyladenosine(37)-N6)-methyltransferase TrmO [Paenibacillus typhae]|uniref:tRNA (N6-threonylcarbamoyladenosine(37)-N6)-methyltransferase TrmO n=1 Tax=Paenibacillus typhae TaxID=1174501 RepID=UPI001C8E4463|nr:tRNA (N6-threonylcarbamoyladenosine(37)-N6)-methyltransferase TrmO [Paenibacillus typhae]MBY0014532.1 tRNA (N6-threonylcarbamoyladenosine(37)-N6)-methyltransferase TrmO [Paenibacillus typhae]